MHEGIPIINYHVPKAFTHEDGQLTGVMFEKVERDQRRAGPAPARTRPASLTMHFACDDVLDRGRPGERLPVDRARRRHRVRQVRACPSSTRPRCSRRSRRCSSAATPRSVPRTSSGRSRTATTPRSPSTSFCHGEDLRRAPAAAGQPACRRRWASTSGATTTTSPTISATRCRSRTSRSRSRTSRSRSSSGFDAAQAFARGAALPQLRRADGVHVEAVHRMRRLRRHLPDGLHHLHRRRRRSGPADPTERAIAQSRRRICT